MMVGAATVFVVTDIAKSTERGADRDPCNRGIGRELTWSGAAGSGASDASLCAKQRTYLKIMPVGTGHFLPLPQIE
jgi:hypothetical protein